MKKNPCELLEEVIEKAWQLAEERLSTAAEMNEKWQSLMDEAFALVDHAGYADRKELSEAHSRELAMLEAAHD